MSTELFEHSRTSAEVDQGVDPVRDGEMRRFLVCVEGVRSSRVEVDIHISKSDASVQEICKQHAEDLRRQVQLLSSWHEIEHITPEPDEPKEDES